MLRIYLAGGSGKAAGGEFGMDGLVSAATASPIVKVNVVDGADFAASHERQAVTVVCGQSDLRW